MSSKINALSSQHVGASQKPDIKTNKDSLSEIFKEKLNHINDLQVQANQNTEELITGEADNIHEVLIKNSEAMLALEMAVQVRNKIVEAYQEIMRMQI